MSDNCRLICFYGTLLTPAATVVNKDPKEGDRLSVYKLQISKPRWVPDEDAPVCYECAVKFTAIRRRHHCRQCGRIFCSTCCSYKMHLPHLLLESAERICMLCKGFSSLLVKAQSTDLAVKLEAASGLGKLCEDARNIISLIEGGGVIALIFVTKGTEPQLVSIVINALHKLSVHDILHTYLVSSGTFKLISRVLMSEDSFAQELLLVCISLIARLCQTESNKPFAAEEGVLSALFPLCLRSDETFCLPALHCLSVVTSHPVVHDVLIDSRYHHILSKLVNMANHTNVKVEIVVLKILSEMSSDAERHRLAIVQEDVYSGSRLANLLSRRPVNEDVLSYAVCLFGNLAYDKNSQGALSIHLVQLCTLLKELEHDSSLLESLARALVNASKFRCNAEILVNHLETIVCKLVQSDCASLKHRGCQIVLSALGHSTSASVDVLNRIGAAEFLHYLGSNSEVVNVVHRVLGTQELGVARSLEVPRDPKLSNLSASEFS